MREVSKKIIESIEVSPQIAEESSEIKDVFTFKEKIENYSEKNISEILEIILTGCIALNSSDLHLEPEQDEIKLRARIDGMLQDITSISPQIFEKVLSRIKLLAGLKLNVEDRPQDGRFSVFLNDNLIEIRASSLPSQHGEAIVLRILNPQNLINIEALELRKDLLSLFKKEIKRPHGMIIVTGPTGSGKTTTLYAFLKELRNPEVKIVTIEDPIEYRLEGISQTQVNPSKGYDFANGLKAIVRQDPDIILVGEIRDEKTTDIGLQAALTGHLVLTTLHTNDAAGAIARLISLGAQKNNIAPAVNVVIAQRLIRKVCKECAKLEKPTNEELLKIKKSVKGLPKNIQIPAINGELKILKSVGCKECNNTGFSGRVGIFEAFILDQEMEKFILKSDSIADLKEKAIESGMVTIEQSGIIKVLQQITTLEEIERITDL
ncbi:MAG: GspE/PulE family protein [Patescibacteria group bacterium]